MRVARAWLVAPLLLGKCWHHLHWDIWKLVSLLHVPLLCEPFSVIFLEVLPWNNAHVSCLCYKTAIFDSGFFLYPILPHQLVT